MTNKGKIVASLTIPSIAAVGLVAAQHPTTAQAQPCPPRVVAHTSTVTTADGHKVKTLKNIVSFACGNGSW